MHYFQFNIGDYRSSTTHLSNEEDLAYRRLLDMYYDTEKKIPLDTEWVARRIRVDERTLTVVLNDMFVKEEDGWSHPRCDEAIRQYQAMAEKNRANGRLGGRKKNPVGSQVDTDSLPIAKATNNYKLVTNNDIKEVPTVLVDKPSASRLPVSPNQEIVDLYHKYLPMCPRVEILSDGRKRSIGSRWRDIVSEKEISSQPDPKKAALDWFEWFFDYVSKSRFLTGRAKDWKADLDFLMTASKFTKVVEGHYHKDKP